MTKCEAEISKLRASLKNSVMNELKQEELIDYFKPIYYVEYEEVVPGELFPKTFRMGYYDKHTGKKEAQRAYEQLNGKRLIEKSMYSGREYVLAERV